LLRVLAGNRAGGPRPYREKILLRAPLRGLVEQLTEPELCFPACLEIVAQLRQALGWLELPVEPECLAMQVSEHPPPQTIFGQHTSLVA
jgi:hypothetical protein